MATSNDYERPGAGFLIFRDYENGEYIYRNQLDSLINYLGGNINAIWKPNRSYYYDWFNESNNLQIVINGESVNCFRREENMGSEFVILAFQKKVN